MVIELHEAYIHTGIKYIRIEFKFNKKPKDFFPLHSGKSQCTISTQTVWEQNFSLHWTCRLVQIWKQEINGLIQFNDNISPFCTYSRYRCIATLKFGKRKMIILISMWVCYRNSSFIFDSI